MKHTPGPWKIDGDNITCNPTPENTGVFIAEMISSRSPQETRDNAHLIAAAPDLLALVRERLIQLEETTRDGLNLGAYTSAWMETAREVIAGTEGRGKP